MTKDYTPVITSTFPIINSTPCKDLIPLEYFHCIRLWSRDNMISFINAVKFCKRVCIFSCREYYTLHVSPPNNFIMIHRPITCYCWVKMHVFLKPMCKYVNFLQDLQNIIRTDKNKTPQRTERKNCINYTKQKSHLNRWLVLYILLI